ncbi:MAG: hypothetical protein SPJ68_02030 [Arcanobacterium sp.]|nr:hypothetical protein [Arcanobacterium sp.]
MKLPKILAVASAALLASAGFAAPAFAEELNVPAEVWFTDSCGDVVALGLSGGVPSVAMAVPDPLESQSTQNYKDAPQNSFGNKNILGLTQKNKHSLLILGVGQDGYARTVENKDNGEGGGVGLSNSLHLMPTDRVIISDDRKEAKIVTLTGELIGHFENPTLVVDSEEIPGEFFYENNSLVTYPDSAHSFTFYGGKCWRGTAAKWTWRVAGTLVCGATGVVTVVGGGVCGLAWAGAEDAMDIYGRAC